MRVQQLFMATEQSAISGWHQVAAMLTSQNDHIEEFAGHCSPLKGDRRRTRRQVEMGLPEGSSKYTVLQKSAVPISHCCDLFAPPRLRKNGNPA
jgi:hypothetical protein